MSKRFCKQVSESSPCSVWAALQLQYRPNSQCNSQKNVYKTFYSTCPPMVYMMSVCTCETRTVVLSTGSSSSTIEGLSAMSKTCEEARERSCLSRWRHSAANSLQLTISYVNTEVKTVNTEQ